MMTKLLCRNFEKFFSNEKKWLQERSSCEYFMFILLISNHTDFLTQFGINLHFRAFQKAEKSHLLNWLQAISAS